jgi:hypothetical protein
MSNEEVNRGFINITANAINSMNQDSSKSYMRTTIDHRPKKSMLGSLATAKLPLLSRSPFI